MAKDGDKKSGNKDGGNSAVISDPRFARVHSDPRFMRVPKKHRKVTIDSRFKSMFEDDNFTSTNIVDKYGRAMKKAPAENLKKYYRLEGEDEEDDRKPAVGDDVDSEEEEEEEEQIETHITPKGKHQKASSESKKTKKMVKRQESSDEEEEEEQQEEEGEGNEEEEEEDEDKGTPSGFVWNEVSSSEEEDEAVEDADLGVDLYQAEDDIPTGEETKRLAVMNCDWDKVKAVDLFTVLQSFVPMGSKIERVTVYPSDFGIEKMKEEREVGPQGIWKKKLTAADKEEAEKQKRRKDKRFHNNHSIVVAEEEGGHEGFDADALRKYELDRLKYYYAVVECDSVKTASTLYEQCDGLELGYSSNFIDLRYIPDDLKSFPHPMRDSATATPANYKAPGFFTRALQHSNVKLTWDETPHDRTQLLRTNFSKAELNEMDLKAYLATSSEDEEEENKKKNRKQSKKEIRKKYEALLFGDDEDTKKDEGGDMEITFKPGLSDLGRDILKKKQEKELLKGETVFEKYQREKKEKKKAKQKERLQAVANNGTTNNDKEEAPMDVEDSLFNDDSGADLDDPFFLQEGKSSKSKTQKGKKGKKGTKHVEEEDEEETANAEKQKQELELLLMGDENGEKKTGFNARHLVHDGKKDKKGKNKKKNRKQSDEGTAETDSFKLDLADQRFQAVFTDPQFALDPTNPAFKATLGTQEILKERQNRRKNQTESGAGSETAEAKKPSKSSSSRASSSSSSFVSSDPSLTALVNNLKRKAETQQTANQMATKKANTSKR
eukprot:GILK01005810.1.p1 GENE.GILK01005810.1~~GILK01005810.1.p1  ORF type:complete len:778 (-),score=263.36 GILK01005810.1:116-2449(-)